MSTIIREAIYIDRAGLCRRWSASRTASRFLGRDGYDPKPVRLGHGITQWPLAGIEDLERHAAQNRLAAAGYSSEGTH